jgi:hypothetical protein
MSRGLTEYIHAWALATCQEHNRKHVLSFQFFLLIRGVGGSSNRANVSFSFIVYYYYFACNLVHNYLNL